MNLFKRRCCRGKSETKKHEDVCIHEDVHKDNHEEVEEIKKETTVTKRKKKVVKE
jgi:hypothetical protein